MPGITAFKSAEASSSAEVARLDSSCSNAISLCVRLSPLGGFIGDPGDPNENDDGFLREPLMASFGGLACTFSNSGLAVTVVRMAAGPPRRAVAAGGSPKEDSDALSAISSVISG
jgi:hypothetical protein